MARHLRLNQEQETKLIEFLKRRRQELDQDNKERIDADARSDKQHENDRKERARLGGVWKHSNMPVPLTCCVVDHFSARTEEEVYGRSPMSQFLPEGPADVDTARGLDRFANYKLFKQGKVRKDLLEANHSAFRHRAQFLKAIYHEEVDQWEEHDVSVLHSSTDQQPVLIMEHGYVIEERDKFIEAVDPVTGKPVLVLEVDPTVALDPDDPAKYYFAPLKKPIRFRDMVYAGAKSREVDSDCIRIPSDARSLDEADVIIEYYDKPSHWVKSRFLERKWMNWKQFEKQVRNGDGSMKTEGERKKVAKDSKAFDMDSASFGIMEFWLTRDVLGWGAPQHIVVWMDRKTDALIDYEFQKKVTPHGRHPYTATAVCKLKQYWWGPSMPELIEPFQDYVDLQWNRHSFRNSINANPIIGQNPDAIAEKKSFLEMEPFEVFTLEQGKTMQDWLQAFVFPNADLDTQELINKAIEWVNFWLGISNIARGDYSDVPQNTTLGGQEASLKEASKLSKRWTRRIVEGLEEHLTKLVLITLATMNKEEAYTYLEGEVTQMGFITEDSVRDIVVNARLVVAKENSTQKLQEQQMTLQVVKEYMTYPPQFQLQVRPVMKNILFLLGHDDVETLLPVPMVQVTDPATGLPTMVPMTAEMAAMIPQAAPNTQEQAGEEKKGGEGGAPAPATPVAPAAPAMAPAM